MNRRPITAIVFLSLLAVAVPLAAQEVCSPQNTVQADVVALDQAFFNNRLGAFQSGGMVFALRGDVVGNGSSPSDLQPGHVMLNPKKRPRPIVLRINVGDCLEIDFQNLLAPAPQVYSQYPPSVPWNGESQMTAANPNDSANPVNKFGVQQPGGNTVIQAPTRWAGVHVMGLDVVGARDENGNTIAAISGDGSFAGANDITADIETAARASGLVRPGGRITYLLRAPLQSEGGHLLYSTGANNGFQPNYGGQLMQGLFGAVTVQPKDAEYYRSQVTREDLRLATYQSANQKLTATDRTVKLHGKTAKVMLWHLGARSHEVVILDGEGDPAASGRLHTIEGQPLINYQACYPAGDTCSGDAMPILRMTRGSAPRKLVHSDLTAIITGPHAGVIIDSPYAEPQPTPNGHQPYREFAIHYHDDFLTTQAFPLQQPSSYLAPTLSAGRDFFAINYGIGGIAAEILANRMGVGPMYQCATCMYEEFFLSSWAVGDPAMVVDVPANSGSGTGPKASKVLYPDDPSNVYHSYVGDHVIFQILHAGTSITHVHHLHAQQWLHSPRNGNSAYRDSQMISPGASYTLNHVYNGSGNVNKTVGDSIFHCHFYPHFAQGMWSMWRVHDMFEQGTKVDEHGKVVGGWNRALPDGEIAVGAPTPAIVPIPTIGMPLIPARTRLVPVNVAASSKPAGYTVEVHPADKDRNPGYPFFIPGVAGQRSPHPPLDFAWEEDANGNPRKDASGKPVLLDGGLPRHLALFDSNITSVEKRWDFTKTNHNLTAVELPEDGTATEKIAMKFHEHRNAAHEPWYASFTPAGLPSHFEVNGEPRAHGAPYANPNRDLAGHKQCVEEETPPNVLDPKEGKQPCLIRYKAADIQIDAVFNKKGWHYPQTRLLTLWGDVKDTINNKRMPEPFFFRANSEQIIEYWLTNLVPAYYELDDFQVRTPTDIIGQHIHLVKFDVTSSDGAGNGYNYEDGTFSPEAVRDTIEAINQCPGGGESCYQCPGGLFSSLIIGDGSAHPSTSKRCLVPKAIPYFGAGPDNKSWLGAQTTIQRWAADPVLGEDKILTENDCRTDTYSATQGRRVDRTLRTVFTHDHFGPSTHQQVGLYAGLLVEPTKSYWIDGQNGRHYGSNQNRPIGADGKPPFDGGPTGWQANIVDRERLTNSYREFALEFADRQLAYTADSIAQLVPYNGGGSAYTGWSDPAHAIGPPVGTAGGTTPRPPFPVLVTNTVNTGTFSLNYRNEPLTLRAFTGAPSQPVIPGNDLSNAFASIVRTDAQLNVQPPAGTRISPNNSFVYPPPFTGAQPTDPYTPLLRAYDGDHVQVRTLVGAHMFPHFFNFHGVNWLFEPQEEDSGYRSAQGMGISEHYEMIFSLPKGSGPTSDYLYETTSDTNGRRNGNWGILRSYGADQPDLVPLPSNKNASDNPPVGCPAGAQERAYKVRAMTIQQATGGQPLYFNTRGQAGANGGQKLADPTAIIYVDESNLDASGKLKNLDRVEPLILRAAAGECVVVTLTNSLPDTSVGSPQALLPAYTNTFLITAPSGTIDDWMITLTGNSGGTQPFYTSGFEVAFNAANKLGYTLPEPSSTAPVSLTYNGNNTTTITSGNQTFVVSKSDSTHLSVATSEKVSLNTSTQAGLHASLLSYDVRDSDGMNVGLNPPQTLAPGASRTYRWYAGRYQRRCEPGGGSIWVPTPVEYGSVNLNPSDPLLQHPKGLIGALIVEPRGATWTVDQNSKASARVAYSFKGGSATESRSFREFVAVIQDDVVLQETPANPRSINIAGDVVNGGPAWTLNNKAQPNNSVYVVNQGDTVNFSSQTGLHGIAFTTGQTAMQSFFDVITAAVPLVQNPNGITGAYGTNPVPGPAALVSLKVKASASGTLPFECSQHKTAMAGTLVIPTHTIAGDATSTGVFWALDGKQQANNSTYTVKPGDYILFDSGVGTHGITFLGSSASAAQQAMEAFFTVVAAPQALSASPNGITNGYGTQAVAGPATLVVLQVKQTASGSLPFECTQHKTNMAGAFQVVAGNQVAIAGDIVNGPVWTLNGKAQSNNATYNVSPGDTVTFTVNAGTHGITFLGSSAADAQAQMQKFFDVVSSPQPMGASPNGITNGFGTQAVPGPANLVTLKVKSSASGSLNFECTQHKTNMAGTFQVSSGISIAGDAANGQVFWALNGVQQPNGSSYSVKQGDVVTFTAAAGPHGITFLGTSAADAQAQMQNFFDVVSSQPMSASPNGITNGFGTQAFPGPATLATLKVKATATGTLNFECTQHKSNMAGVFTIGHVVPPQTFTPASNQWSRAFNYKIEPLQYRYQNPDFLTSDPALAPAGIVRAMSDQLTLSDPETPVFAAAAGDAVRIRMLHPAGVDEQVLTLHGHSWEEEPYQNGTSSTVIGHNSFSQRNGSRDSFGPNVSWDMVIGRWVNGHVVEGAGGMAKTKGDFMFRTFIGTDFLAGLWGILRVGDPDKDIVTVTYFPKPGSDARYAPGIRGTVTANTSTGRMADTIEIYAGSAPVGTPVDRVKIDRNTGKWASAANLPAPPLLVRSVCDTSCNPAVAWGSALMPAYIPTRGQTTPGVTGAAGTTAVTTIPATPGNFGEVSSFKPDAQPQNNNAAPLPKHQDEHMDQMKDH